MSENQTVPTVSELEKQEQIIEASWQAAFLETANALRTIRDERLYKGRGYKSFADYVAKRWDKKRSWAYQLIDSIGVYENVSAIADISPMNESQARPLAKLKEPTHQQRAWKKAVDRAEGAQPTAKQVEQAVEALKTDTDTTPEPDSSRIIEPFEYNGRTLYIQTGEAKPQRFNRQTSDSIEWALWSWNPVTGCLHNCNYCYARDIANRFYPTKFDPTFHPERLDAPEHTKVPEAAKENIGEKNVFTVSMGDLFGKWVPQEWIEAVLKAVLNAPQWNFLFLTKFPQRLAAFEFPPNAWIGTTVDYQWRVDEAERAFSDVNAAVKFLSCEPMEEPLRFHSLAMFDWVIIGGRSQSTGAPASQPHWQSVFELMKQAENASCKVYFKTNLTFAPKEYPQEDVQP